MAKIYIDAAASLTPKLACGGVIIKDGDINYEESVMLGEMDNHEAEWATLLFALKEAEKLGIKSVIVYTDSKIIVDTFDKEHVKNKIFKSYYSRVLPLTNALDMFIITHTPRKNNRGADKLAKDRLYKERKNLSSN
ncbi:14.7 kDa ribonuclease H-like protein [Jeotgalicoccus saudimassiliensis]|uniref:14.7 kDa ribonuclease H-like protein n=1 Tax=Jeotgalicoccus saudimassiliensis TaxID=1461582 RepID=A0A078M246_9STAP|nr:ribonuclease HI family protein [Jeotgalicoccus saudimassiliensis]CEA00250.1 14.7 kDa ribonuclease H-like protein [Jeotgalicoccus saudimassiliensis]